MIKLKEGVRERIDQSVRVRTLVWLILGVSLVLSAALIFIASRFFRTYDGLKEATDSYFTCQQAMSRLQDGSNYLTDQVRAYAVTGDRECMEDYFREANMTRRRDKALFTLQENISDDSLLIFAHEAMQTSNDLMLTEYYIMRLRALGDGIPDEDQPEEIRQVLLRPEDLNLSEAELRERAANLAFGVEYKAYRQRIDERTGRFLTVLLSDLWGQRENYSQQLQTVQRLTYGLIIAFFGVVCIAFAVVYRLVIRPLIHSSDLLEHQRLLPIVGAREMRLLSANYNAILEKQLARQEQLVYANDHDSLTGAYSRAVFDRFCADPGTDEPIALMLVDLDYFKRINDSFGHSVGDKVLKRAAELLMGAFRSGDLVCRIGGDEFTAVVFNVTPQQKSLLEEKLLTVEDSLKHPGDDDVPPCSLSIGVVFGSARDAKELQVKADTAMYRAKKAGRGTVVFL